jgi:alpha-beta hydrolase superfamily lysophospholipase
MNMKNLLAPIGAICMCSIFIGCSQESLIFYPEILPPDYSFAFSEPFEEVTVPVDAATLHALLFRAKNKGTDFKSVPPVVLYLHGNAGSLSSWGAVATDFTSRGYDVMIPDYRGFGKSSGKITNEKQLLDDGLAVYRLLTKTWPENRIIVYGRSIGTGVATHIAQSGNPGMLILESPFLNLNALASYHYPYLPQLILSKFLRYPLRNDLWIGDVACPVYIFHGTKDNIIPFDQSVRLEKLIRAPHRLIRIEGGGHNDLSDFATFDRELDQILR